MSVFVPLETEGPAGPPLLRLAVLAGLLLLQVLLSRGKSRWPGLVLPALALMSAVVAAMGLLAPSLILGTGVIAIDPSPPPLPQALWVALAVFLVQNIPTAVCLAVYLLCRARRAKRQRELEQMDVQDL